jgi:hypothetical protein
MKLRSKLLFLYFTAVISGVLNILPVQAQPKYSVYKETAITDIHPEGWMHKMLEKQRDGLTGHIEVAGDPFDKEGWGYADQKKMTKWQQYEQTAYWADGALRCGYLIEDQALKKKVKDWIYYQINHPDKDGFIGPKDVPFLWPEVVFYRAVMAEYEATRDKHILQALEKNYRSAKYSTFNNEKSNFFKDRLILHIEMMCWLYDQTNDRFFLDKSERAYKEFCADRGEYSMSAMNADTVPRSHSVSYSENLKIPIILYMYTGKGEYLNAALNAIQRVYKYHGLVDGLPSGNELHDGNFSNEVHETCTASDMQWTLGYLLQATGDVKWADLIERICFNAGMGSVAKDFKSYQYYSGPNQVIADGLSSHWNDHESFYMNSRDRASFRIDHKPSCCGGNLSRILPVFCSRMWMTKGTDGIVAALYSPSTFKTFLQDANTAVEITEETQYPFNSQILFKVNPSHTAAFSIWLRIPAWCDQATISINGKPIQTNCKKGTFVEVKRKYTPGDVIALNLPMRVNPVKLPGNGIAFERGALVYSLPVTANTTVQATKVQDGVTFASTYKKPVSVWNFAAVDSLNVKVNETGDYSDPWNPEHPPVTLEIPAIIIKNWNLYRNVYTPDLPNIYDLGDHRNITLVPLGSTELRLTVFPDLTKRTDLKHLTASPLPASDASSETRSIIKISNHPLDFQ